ncbi:MAG: phosphatidate cytidylyltransferase [Clostridia bacterium]|nr:phosphatidate cytidylyltransferase [Clostridia bacterium]
MSKLRARVTSGLIGAALVLIVVFSSAEVFHAAIAIACFIALYELHRTFDQQKKWQIVIINYLFALIFLLTPLFSSVSQKELITFLFVSYLMILLICSVLFHDTVKFSDVSRSFFSLAYSVLLPLHLIYIRNMNDGLALVFLVFIGAWMPDIFAYFSGCLLGKHKLIPNVSPNKTIEGAVGAVVGAVAMFALYGFILSFFFHYTVNYWILLFLSLLCGVASQFGDLAASVIKRETGKKDFGNLIPGHGGIIDRMDSLIFIAPLTYYFLLFFEVICK